MTVDCQPGDQPLDLSSPYPGPRPFPRPEKRDGEELEKQVFFGRDSERQDLYDLLIAERIVVLYSPSGAGKTSLVQAALIPDMEDRGFEVLPVMRCSLKPQEKIDPAANRYVLSLFLSLEEDLEPEERRPLADLVSRACKERSLNEYLSERKENAESKAATSRVKGTVLIFDQFEEIFTEDFTDHAETAAFFRQVSAALRHPRRWALFVMREEFLGSLGSAVRRMPAQFRARFGLEYLAPWAAREAIVQPACQHGVDFQEDAAEELVNNLRQVLDPGASGEGERKPGPYIEPVQLQLVCEQLWQKRIGALDAGTHLPPLPAITMDDVREFGDVDRALGTYYAGKVTEASEATGVRERRIRAWIDLNLITGRGYRDQVQHEPDATRGLENEVLTLLARAHVLRAERRRDLTWYELSHDRWIWPIQESNRAWREASLSDLQMEAKLWAELGRPDDHLLRGRALSGAESWAKEHPRDVEPHEIDFLKKSRSHQRKHRTRIGLAAVACVILLALVLYIVLLASRGRGMQVALTEVSNINATRAATAETAVAAADQAAQATSAAGQAVIATADALRVQLAGTRDADPSAPTSEAVAEAETRAASIETRVHEENVAAESTRAMAAADQLLAQAQNTAAAQAASTLQPVPQTPSPPEHSTVFVPSGCFLRGSEVAQIEAASARCYQFEPESEQYPGKFCAQRHFEDEWPQHEVCVDDFHIDQYEVTNEQYEACVQANVCNPPAATKSHSRDLYFGHDLHADYPVIYVSWLDAEAYCRWVGMRLPTEAEWEKAARGVSGAEWPWGDSFSEGMCNTRPQGVPANAPNLDTVQVGSFQSCESQYGAMDMVGNVWEWVADWHGEGYYSEGVRDNPLGPPSGEFRVTRGGSWNTNAGAARAALRTNVVPDKGFMDFGFRCASD
ncbi:MAG: SUMF1/EgtB/PvdO family nonheme iron enzyme [Anaerolineae bacterium]|jgi:formylglycine-generating enzyme required for sulfatase activity